MLLSLQSGLLVEFRILAVAAFLAVDRLLIAVQVIGIVPISVAVLRAQTIGVYRRVHSPGVNLFERVILVDKKDAVAIFLEKPGEKCLVHARTERALEIVIVDDRHLGIFVAARRTAADVNLLHDLGVRITGEIQLCHAHQRLVIAGEQELELLFLVGAGKSNRKRVIIRKLTRPERPQNHFNVGLERVMRPHLPLDHMFDVRRRGLGRAAQTDQEKDQKRASHHHQSKPPEHEQTLDYLMAGRHPVWSLLLRASALPSLGRFQPSTASAPSPLVACDRFLRSDRLR